MQAAASGNLTDRRNQFNLDRLRVSAWQGPENYLFPQEVMVALKTVLSAAPIHWI
jgi:hypothetical protein